MADCFNFSNNYLRWEARETGVLEIGSMMRFWAFVYILVSLWLLMVKKEVSHHKIAKILLILFDFSILISYSLFLLVFDFSRFIVCCFEGVDATTN